MKAKKCGAESSDPNRHSQPRLPGSVVGEASMRCAGNCGKITKVSGFWLRRGGIGGRGASASRRFSRTVYRTHECMPGYESISSPGAEDRNRA